MKVTKFSEKVNLIIPALMLLLFFSFSNALVVRAPNEVTISEKQNSFEIYIYNDSQQMKNLNLQINMPVEYTLRNMPNIIAPKNSANIIVVVDYNEKFALQNYKANIEINAGDERIIHEFKLKFAPKEEKVKVIVVEKEEKETKKETNLSQLSGMFLLPLEISFNELILDIILVIIAAVLLIAFISRYIKRLHEMQV